jgi:hypothetical protein
MGNSTTQLGYEVERPLRMKREGNTVNDGLFEGVQAKDVLAKINAGALVGYVA